jgi:hypothetical protein
VHSPLPGFVARALVPEGASVASGSSVLSISPDQKTVWEALRALYLIGTADDIPLVESYLQYKASRFRSTTNNSPNDADIRQQARATLDAIRNRYPQASAGL